MPGLTAADTSTPRLIIRTDWWATRPTDRTKICVGSCPLVSSDAHGGQKSDSIENSKGQHRNQQSKSKIKTRTLEVVYWLLYMFVGTFQDLLEI
jgi:hypothetical protein